MLTRNTIRGRMTPSLVKMLKAKPQLNDGGLQFLAGLKKSKEVGVVLGTGKTFLGEHADPCVRKLFIPKLPDDDREHLKAIRRALGLQPSSLTMRSAQEQLLQTLDLLLSSLPRKNSWSDTFIFLDDFAHTSQSAYLWLRFAKLASQETNTTVAFGVSAWDFSDVRNILLRKEIPWSLHQLSWTDLELQKILPFPDWLQERGLDVRDLIEFNRLSVLLGSAEAWTLFQAKVSQHFTSIEKGHLYGIVAGHNSLEDFPESSIKQLLAKRLVRLNFTKDSPGLLEVPKYVQQLL